MKSQRKKQQENEYEVWGFCLFWRHYLLEMMSFQSVVHTILAAVGMP